MLNGLFFNWLYFTGTGQTSIIKITSKNSILSVSNCVNVEVAYLQLEGNNISTSGISVASTNGYYNHQVLYLKFLTIMQLLA